jgi:hypothetical protein
MASSLLSVIFAKISLQDDQQFRIIELTSHTMLEQWVHSAKTLLYHWRNFVKGQVVFNTLGMKPSSIGCDGSII